MSGRIGLLTALVALSSLASAETARGANGLTTTPHGSMAAKPGHAVPQDSKASIKPDAPLPANHPAAIPADTRLVYSGEVLEVLDTDMYTYLRVSSAKGPLWIAGYKTAVSKGETVKYSGGIAMPGFHSKSLNRSFEMIVFVDSMESAKR